MKSETKTTTAKKVRVRAAPSPTGKIHVGNLRTFLYDFLLARNTGGTFILRVEDTDARRCVKGGKDAIVETLNLYGINFDEGPGIGGDYGPYVQSERLDIYKATAEKLVEQGDAYYCFCTEKRLEKLREEQVKNKMKPMYDRKCRNLDIKEARKRVDAGEPYVIRMKVPLDGVTEYEDAVLGVVKVKNSSIEDQILLKADGFPTYHLALVADDPAMKITHVIRAVEWLPSTPKHVLLYGFLGETPPLWVHPTVILNPDGRGKLSKRHGAMPSEKYLRKGYLPEAVLNYIALLGWAPPPDKAHKNEIYTLDELIKLFSLDRLHKSAARHDQKKFDYVNGMHIRRMSVSQLCDAVIKWAEEIVLRELKADKCGEIFDWEVELREKVEKYLPLWKKDRELFEKAMVEVRERLVYLGELPDLIGFVYDEELEYGNFVEDIKKFGDEKKVEVVKDILSKLKELMAEKPVDKWTHDSWEKTIRDCADDHSWKHGHLFMLLRIAVTGSTASPPLFECMSLIGWEKTEKFISDFLKFLESM